ncbi:hypothetical protein JCM8208_004285 [Rhodotorula glutinis]
MAPYSALPAELVSRVADLVHEQDRAWPHLGLMRREHPSDRDSDFEDDHGCSAKPWSDQYGHGIRALVRVDRRTRSAALPFLYKNITGRATTKTFFRMAVLGRPLGDHVRQVDCRFDTPDQVVSLACALQGLPNLTSIKVEGNLLMVLAGAVRGDEPEALAQALKDVLNRVTSLEMDRSTPQDILHALSYVDKRRLRHLVVGQADMSLLPPSGELAAAIASLEALVHVELRGVSTASVDQLQQYLRFPHARTLSISRDAVDGEPTYEAVLVFAHHVAPLIEVLLLPDAPAYDAPFPRGSPERLMPDLRVLRVIAYDTVNLSRFRLANLPPLEHLHVTVPSDQSVFPVYLSDVQTLRPTSPRIIVVEYSASRPLAPPAPFLAECDELGTRLVTHWRPSTEPAYSGVYSAADDDVEALEERQVEAGNLGRLFEWAGERARWLVRFGDGPGLMELSQAAVRLRERFVIEHS